MDSLAVEDSVRKEWWSRYERLAINLMSIRTKLQRRNLSPNKRKKLEWQLTRLEKVSIPKHLSQQT